MYLKKCKNKCKMHASNLIKVLSYPRSNHAWEINYQSRPWAFMIKNKGYL